MDNLEIYTMEQGSNAWFEVKAGRITGSRFKDMMAGKSTATYKNLINTCIGEILSGQVEDTYTSQDMLNGIEREPEALEMYSEQRPDEDIRQVGFVVNPEIYPEYVGFSPDLLVVSDNGMGEIKCPKMHTHVGYLRYAKVPNPYKWQVQGGLLITGAKYCDFISYYPGINPFILRVLPDEEMQAQLLQRMGEAIDDIKQGLFDIQDAA